MKIETCGEVTCWYVNMDNDDDYTRYGSDSHPIWKKCDGDVEEPVDDFTELEAMFQEFQRS